MKHARFTAGGVYIDTNLDLTGRYWTAWKPDTSCAFRDTKALVRWIAWPPKTPTGDAIRAWINDIVAADAQRHEPVQPVGDAQVEGSFDPLAHGGALDASDPNFATRTIL